MVGELLELTAKEEEERNNNKIPRGNLNLMRERRLIPWKIHAIMSMYPAAFVNQVPLNKDY